MKICHLTSVHEYNDIRIAVKECTTLVNAGYDVHLIVPNTEVTEFNGVTIHGLFNKYIGRLNRIKKFTKEIYHKAIELDADVYHFHDPELIPVGLNLKRKGKKVIYDIHEDVPRQIMTKYWIPKRFRKVISVIFERYENYAAKKFDYLVTATPFIKNRFLDIGCTVININNYPKLEELYNFENLNSKENAAVYVGGITPSRGIKTMISSLDYVNGSLYLAGNFSKDQIYEEVSTYEGWGKVNYLGQINRDEVKEVLNKSLIGLVLFDPSPNHINAQPNKMFEYMSASLPVLASNFALWKKIVENNNCGVCVDPLNDKDIGDAIQWFIDNPEKAKEMGQNGRKAVENYYNWEQEAVKLLNLYKKI